MDIEKCKRCEYKALGAITESTKDGHCYMFEKIPDDKCSQFKVDDNASSTQTNEEKFKESWLDYLADDNGFTWQRWNKLRQVMFAMGKTSEQVEALMNEAEGKSSLNTPIAPSTFSKIFPIASICGQSEYEMVAQNVMAILKRKSDTFRLLSWEEYKLERIIDGNFTEREKKYFDKVVGSCEAEEKARKFSKEWLEA